MSRQSDSDSDIEVDSNQSDPIDSESENTCECGMEKIKCKHILTYICPFCEPLINREPFCESSDICFRGQCLLCLIFEGARYEDQWDSLDEALDSIGFRAYEIGMIHGQRDEIKNEGNPVNPLPKFVCNQRETKSIAKFYLAGYNAGYNQIQLQERGLSCAVLKPKFAKKI